MVSGQRPFLGQYDQALLYEIVHEEIAPLTSIRAGVPMELEFIVGKCLAKDRDDRTGAAQEVSRELRTLAEKIKSGHSTILRTGQMTGAVPATMTGARMLNPAATLPPDAMIVKRHSQRALQALAALVTIALLGVSFAYFTQSPPPTPLRRFSFAPDAYVQDTSVISPDGKVILYRAGTGDESSLWLRSLSDESAREVAGTAGAEDWAFWSPDSLSIGFHVGTELKRVSVTGGDPITLCELPGQTYPLLGGTWSPDGERIVFSSGLRLYQIPARGGQPEMLFDPGDSPRALSVVPHFLPADAGPQGLVYVAAVSPEDQMVAVMDLETGERRELAPGSFPVYSSDGHLIHGSMDGSELGLRALPFSLDTLEATGQPYPIDETGRAASVALDGTLVYTYSGATAHRQIVVRDRTGRLLRTVGDPIDNPSALAVAPNGRRIAASVGGDVWVYDLDRDLRSRLTSRAGEESRPVWASDTEVSYGLEATALVTQVADGSRDAVMVLDDTPGIFYFDWSADGRYLVYTAADPEGPEGGLWYREKAPDGSLSQSRCLTWLLHSEKTGQCFLPMGVI